MTTIKTTFISLLIVVSYTLSAQIIGGRASGQLAPKEASAAELNPGAYSGSVNLFNGVFSSSYPVGTVSTPTGLSHTVSLNYSGTFSGGDNVPHVSGVPYGEGWNVSIPTISISTEDYSKYTLNDLNHFKTQNCTYPNHLDPDCDRPYFANDQEIQEEGSLYWFAPQLSIPGVASGRLVFKCEDDNESIFVLNTFEDYIEARFDGHHWRVILSSGIVYEFRYTRLSDRNASNQRMDKHLHNNKQNIAASVIPKTEITSWYVSKIRNPNVSGDEIRFRYKTYGKFNFYKEYLQPRLSYYIKQDLLLAGNSDCHYIYYPQTKDPEYLVCNGDTLSATINGETVNNIEEILELSPFTVGPFTHSIFNPKIERFNVYRDIFLQEVTAHSGFIMTEKLDLEYETLDVNPADVNNMLLLSDSTVYQKDDLYNYKTVYHQGRSGGTPREYTPNSDPDDFSNWQRYKHFGVWDYTSAMEQRSATNPYMASEKYYSCNSKMYYKKKEVSSSNETAIPFNHSFLESERISRDFNHNVLPSGELYEVKTLIHAPQGKDGFCNFDINIITGNTGNGAINCSNPSTNISQDAYKKTRGVNIFNTFNQSMKWNPAAHNVFSDGFLYTSNVFSMPNLPEVYEGMYIQVGPGNSDHIFNRAPEHFDNLGDLCSDGINSFPKNYSTYAYETDPSTVPYTFTAPVPNNFGVGLPWYMLDELYNHLDDVDLDEYCAATNHRGKFWWNYTSGSVVASWDNKPTLADDRFTLQAVELIRYSKNPYMLKRVKHYKINGIFDNVHTEGLKLVKSFEMSYSAQRDETYDARSDQNKLIVRTSEYDRNLFFLDSIEEIPTNPTEESLGNLPNENPTTHFKYEKQVNKYYHAHHRSNANVWTLHEIINPLGGETIISYHPMDANSAASQYQYSQDQINWNDPDLNLAFEMQRTRPTVLTLYPRVESKTICSGDNGLSKTWTYNYLGPINRSYTINLNDQLKRDVQLDIQRGFSQTIVTEPTLEGGGNPETIHNHHTGPTLFGKLSDTKTYTPTGQLLQETGYKYSITSAYKNMMQTGVFLNGADNRYYKAIQNDPEVNPNSLNTDFQLGTTKIKFYETHFFHDENFQKEYQTSSFIKLASQTTTHHDPDGSGHQYSIKTSNDFFEADTEGKPIGGGYSEFLNTGNQLSYDPSWKLYSTSTSSDQAPDSESGSKHFYFYDLLNVYQTSEGTIDDDFDALSNVYTLGRRNLVYEERTRKASGGGSVENVSYYEYDSDWNQVRDIAPSITVEVDTTDLTPCGYTLEEEDVPPTPCYGYSATEECCVPRGDLNHDPPYGFYATFRGGKPVYCRPPLTELESAFSADIQGLTDAVNDNPGGAKLYNLDDPLSASLFLRKIHVKISDLPANGSSATQFAGNNYKPIFPFETWEAYEVLERNRFGQVSLEENERGLLTNYGYQKFQPIWYTYEGGVAGNYGCYNYSVTNQENIGVPKYMTVGAGLEDSLHYTYAYHPNYAVKNITDPNGLAMDYHYDQFGRLHEVKRAGKRISTHEYHQWQNDTTLSFQARTAQNWVKSQVYHTQDESISTVAYVDPIGRKKATLSAATNENDAAPPDGIIVENVQYDNWDRVIESQKPSEGGTIQNLPAQLVGFTTSIEYENDQRGRPLKSYNYDGTFVQINYQMIDGTTLATELELNAAEESELLLNQAADFVIQKVETTDEDGKKLMEYSNIFGQKMATKQFIGGAEGYAITLFFYDGHGNVKKVINPEKQVSTYTYNLMNWLESKTSVDGGTYSYQHNASGQVRIAFEPLATRIFDYDIFGRMTNQKRIDENTQFQWNFDSIILPDNEPVNGNFIPEKEWFYHGHLYDNPNGLTFHPKVLEFTPHISNEKGRLTQSISYNHHGRPIHYNFYTYLIEGYLEAEIKQFNPKGIAVGEYGNTFGVSYKAYNLQGSVLMTGSNTDTKGMGMRFYYDEWNRLSEVDATLMPHYFEAKMASYTYDDPSGLLLQTDYYNSSLEFELQNTPETACRDVLIDNIVHQYDVRNRLTSMSSATFDYSLYYDENLPTGVSGSFNRNGNINATSAHYKLDNPKVTFGGGEVAMAQNYLSNPTLSYGYVYDGLNRLTHAFTDPSNSDLEGSANYSYDKIGNLLSLNRAGAVKPDSPPMPDNYTYQYELGKNRLLYMASTNSMGKSFTYDGAGNLETSYGHSTKANVSSVNMDIENGRGNLPYQIDINETITAPNQNDPNNGYVQLSQVNYDYDANDQRVYKKVALDQGEITEEYYIFDATGRVLAVHNLQTEDTDWYVHGRERIARFQTRESDAGLPVEAGNEDGSWAFPESFHFPNDYVPHVFPLYYIYDHLGNTRVTYRNLFECSVDENDGTGSYPTHYILKHLHDYFPYGKTLREWYATNEDTERFQTTHHQRDTETTLDYRGARLYGGDVGRFLSLDPLAADFPTESAYLYVGGNPNIFIDPNGKEKIVVAGGEFDHPERYKYNFVETSIHQLKKMKQKAGTESVTWVVMAAGYSKKDIKKMKRIAKGLGVGFEIMESAQELTNYLNSKDKSTSELSDERTSDKITDLSVFAHGFTKSAEFAYNQGGLQSTYSWDSDQSEQLNSDAFESSNICFYTCNSATDSNDSFVGNSLIKSVSNSTKALSTMGYWGRSDYATVNEGESYYHKINRKVNGFNIYGSRSLPSLGTKDSRGTTSTKVTIKR